MSRPRRSSFKCLPESIVCENSVLEKTFPRRVSFANVISVCGNTEGITQLPLSKCSEESNESTKRTTLTSLMFPDISSVDVSMNICSDASMQDSPVCKPRVNEAVTSSNTKMLSNIVDVSMSDASALAHTESPAPVLDVLPDKVQYYVDLHSSSMQISTKTVNVETSDISMTIDDTHICKDDFINMSHGKSACTTPKTVITTTDRSVLGVINQSTQVSLCIESMVQPDILTDTTYDDARPTHICANPTTSQSPKRYIISTIQMTPAQQPMDTASSVLSMQSRVFSIPPLKSDPCLWNSAPESRRRKRLLPQSALRWDDINKRTLHHSGNDIGDVDNLKGSHSLSLNNTPIRRIKPRLDWLAPLAERKYNIPLASLQDKLYMSQYFKAELETLTGEIMTHTRLIPTEITTAVDTTTLSALLDMKNLPLPIDGIDLGDLCGPPPSVTELDVVLEKLSESQPCDTDPSQAWWAKSSNLNSLADTLSNSHRLLLYGKRCLDRQNAVLDTCPSAKLTENVDVPLCYFTALETLYRCHSEAMQELKELTNERHKSRQSHLQSQVDFLHQVDDQLTGECKQLQEELDALNSEIADWEAFEMEDKENLQGATPDEDLQLAEVLEQLRPVDLQLEEAKKAYAADHWKVLRQRQSLMPPSRAVGCTELFDPTGSFINNAQHTQSKAVDMSESEELINLLCPSRLRCLDHAKHKYHLVCLLGHLEFVFTCRPCPSPSGEQQSTSCASTAEANSSQCHVVEDLLIETVIVQRPEAALSPIDCSAVERLAQVAVDFFNSPHKLASGLRTRLVGMSLAEAIDYIEFVQLPYLVAACDLRSVYIKGHSVQFFVLDHDPDHMMPMPDETATLSSILSAAPFELTSEQISSYPCWEQIIPPWPVMVSVELNHLPTRSIVAVKFTFDRLDFHRMMPCSTSVDVLIGQSDSQTIQSMLDKEEIKLGQLHRIVSLIEANLSST